MKYPVALAFAVTFLAITSPAQVGEEGFTPLMDGKTFAGWEPAKESPGTWKVEDGAFVCQGPRCHLFYVGAGAPFKNFELKVEVMTVPGANGGIYFHTAYQDTGWPKAGFECQVNNTHSDWKKTGSIYDVANIGFAVAEDNKWWTQDITVEGNTVTVKIDGKIVLQYQEPPGAQSGKDFGRKLGSGTFALQAHDPVLAKGVNILAGKVTYQAVAEAHGLEYTPLADALPDAG